MNVTVHSASTDMVGVEIELDYGRTYLMVNVSIPHESEEGKDARFKRRFHARIKRLGPRGGWREEPKTIGFGTLDLRQDVTSIVTGR